MKKKISAAVFLNFSVGIIFTVYGLQISPLTLNIGGDSTLCALPCGLTAAQGGQTKRGVEVSLNVACGLQM